MSEVAPSRRCGQRGQAAIEFALTIGFLVILLISMLEMTIFLYNYAVLTDAAKEGVRYAIVHGASGTNPSGPSSTQAVTNAVKAYAAASLHSTSGMTINVTYATDNNPGSEVEVNVSYAYQPLFLVSWPNVTISANSAGRIMF
jgi:Flp pilus assembly protein TadG